MGLFDIFTTDAADKAAEAQKAGLAKGLDQYGQYAAQGRDALNTSYAAGLKPYQQNFDVGSAGQKNYADATGANGPAGNAQALTDFQTSPGYQFSLDQGAQNLMRNKAATGQLASGGTNVDLMKQGVGAADQEWQAYVKNLLPFLSTSANAANGIGTLNAGLGNSLNTSLQNQGGVAYQTATGQGAADATAALDANRASAQGINTIMDGIKLAASLAGGMPSFGGAVGGSGAGGLGGAGAGFASPAQRA